MLNSRSVLATLAVALIAAAVTACGSGDGSPAPATKTVTATETISKTPTVAAERLTEDQPCSFYISSDFATQTEYVTRQDVLHETSAFAYLLTEYCRQHPDTLLQDAGTAVISEYGPTSGDWPTATSAPLTDGSTCSDYNSAEDQTQTTYEGLKAQEDAPVLHHTGVLAGYCHEHPDALLGDAVRYVERHPDEYGGRVE